jgi:ribosomal protein RSM22 (predicted rRNA methylase)
MSSNFIQENLIGLSSVKQDYYLKKIFNDKYVKNVLLPSSAIRGNVGNLNGIKITGKNYKKLVSGRIKTTANCIRKEVHNFNSYKELGFFLNFDTCRKYARFRKSKLSI